jgi:hypothetical protein
MRASGGSERRKDKERREAESAEGAQKAEEKRFCAIGSSEPTLRRLREGWATLMLHALDGATGKTQEHNQE